MKKNINMIYSISYFVYLLNETLDKQLYDATIKEKYKIKNQVSNKSQVVILLVNLRENRIPSSG